MKFRLNDLVVFDTADLENVSLGEERDFYQVSSSIRDDRRRFYQKHHGETFRVVEILPKENLVRIKKCSLEKTAGGQYLWWAECRFLPVPGVQLSLFEEAA